MKLTLIAEGSTKWQRFIKHWGLSILIDDDILFDTFGKQDYVLKQLKRFGADPGKVKHIVISHNDWDHVAGLWKILERNNSTTVYICPDFSPDIKAKIKSYGACFVEAYKPAEIRSNVYVSGELKGGTRGGAALPEQYLAVKTPKGIVVITGCAHPGIVEIVQHANASLNSGVHLLIGGFHLKDNSNEVNSSIVAKLKELGVRQVAPLHCTGKSAAILLKQEFKKEYVDAREGNVIEV